MCGIAGILHHDSPFIRCDIGRELLTMSSCLQHRGADSAGIAVFGSTSAKHRIQVSLPHPDQLPEPQYIERLTSGALSSLRADAGGFSATISANINNRVERTVLVDRIESGMPGSVVTSLGLNMSVYKTVGEVKLLQEAVAPLTGSHGISHLRLATESKIDPAHAQPFWGRPFPDVAVTHNGHITNYFKQRQKLEARGYSFASQNDSEIIGILIGEQLSLGCSLREALNKVTPELDGSFSFIVATADGIGVTRDPFATKPLLYVETDKLVAIASEQQALHRLLGETLAIKEIDPKEIRTWEKA